MSKRRTEAYFSEWINRTSAERIHSRADFCRLLAERDAEIDRLKAVLDAARHHAQDQYARELAEKISTYDKERDDE